MNELEKGKVITGADFTGDDTGRQSINVKYSYPNDPDYWYFAGMPRINFDEEKSRDLRRGNGFLISAPKAKLKKDIKNGDGIFSTKFGQRLGDQNPFMDRYSCECVEGGLKGAINNGLLCPKCGKICKFVDDDFSKFGWIEIDKEYSIINPDMFKQLDQFFGKSKYLKNTKKKKGSVLDNIIDFDREMDQHAKIIGYKEKPGEPYYGIGMIEFKERFQEIFDFYYQKNHKKDIYDDIMADKDKLFINSIPVYTTLLRPMDIVGESLYYEKTNGYYSMISKLAQSVNKNRRNIDRDFRIKNLQLYKLQMKYMKLYDEIVEILSGKKGEARNLVSGRFNFTGRCVIKQNPNLRIDQVELPYVELVITQQQRIINILHKSLNITYQEAYDKWFKAISTVDKTVVDIIRDIIRTSCNGEGLPTICNRNPTISFSSIIQMYCIGINFDYTMSMPLQVLDGLGADFDGDTLNVLHIINEDFYRAANEIFNPRNSMYISRADGMLNSGVIPKKDSLVNVNTMNYMTLGNYTDKELNHIKKIKEKAANE